MQALGSLHNWVGQWIYGQMTWCWNILWEYPQIVEALSDAGLDPIWGYISQHYIIAAQYITTRPIFDLAVAEGKCKRYPETILSQEQEGMWFINEGRGAY